ncbi:ATP-binding protein [Kiloniella antarctica]|uniref:histidine kinase n=1 Tax=Kiloniella antarctica TaxID=1550907 RepID=A0ABW5BF39_9PROT
MINLLTNAIKFTPAGGTVSMQARHTLTKRMIISVRDTGVGINKEDLLRVQEPFAQAENAFTKKTPRHRIGFNDN